MPAAARDTRPAHPSRSPEAGPWRVLAVSSSGGVLLDLLALRPWLSRHRTTWVVPPAPDTDEVLAGERVLPRADLPGDAPPWRLAAALGSGLALLRRERPDLVVSAGTGLAVPLFAAARLVGVPCVWVETLNIVRTPGRAARLCGRLAALRLVQSEALLDGDPRVRYIGELY